MTIVKSLESKLQGWPDSALSVALVVTGIALIGVAVFARPVVKPLVLAWVLAP